MFVHVLPPSPVLQPAFGIGPEQMADRGDVDDVGILRMDDDATDALGLFQTDVDGILAPIRRLVNATPER